MQEKKRQLSTLMSELNFSGFRKDELLEAAKKIGIHALAKDTKKVLVDKFTAYIDDHPEDGVLTVQSVLELDSDEETATEDAGEDLEGEAGADYQPGPPINLKEWVVDPAIDLYERAYSQVLGLTDKVGITTLDINDELRENLSKLITLNFLEVFLEFSFFLYTFVPIKPIKHNPTVHQVFKDNIEYLSTSTFPLPDITALWDPKVLSVAFNWAITAILVPLVISYYVNFSRRVIVYDEDAGIVARIYKFDPFVYALSKLLIFYFITKNFGHLTTLTSYKGIWNALKNFIAIQLGIYGQFTSLLGNFPLVIGAANVVTAIYSQFEEY